MLTYLKYTIFLPFVLFWSSHNLSEYSCNTCNSCQNENINLHFLVLVCLFDFSVKYDWDKFLIEWLTMWEPDAPPPVCTLHVICVSLSYWWSWSEISCRMSLDSSDHHSRPHSSCCYLPTPLLLASTQSHTQTVLICSKVVK